MFKRLSVVGYAATNGLHKFICDDTSDINHLPTMTSPSTTEPHCEPCQAGSIAYVIGQHAEYMLNNANEWTYFKDFEGGVSITTDDGDLDVATVGEVSDYLND